DAGGQPLQVRSGASIGLNMQPASANPPATVPFFMFDDVSGLWQQRGTLTLVAGRYKGTINHLSTFNADLAFGTTGCVEYHIDPANSPALPFTLHLEQNGTAANHAPFVVTDFAGVVARLVPATATDWWALPTPTSAKADAIGHGSVTSSNFTSNPADPNGDFPPVGAVNASSQPVCTKFTITADYPAHETFLTGLAGNATHAEEAAYSTAVDTWAAGAHNTFNDFKATYGFPAGEASAVYFNNADLKLGRDMHCRTATGGVIACYVSNYLDNVTPPAGAAAALQATAKGHEGTSTNLLFATVAMVWDPGKPADVSTQFFVYPADPNGPRVTEAQLDDEGPKPVPQICTPCHGGSFEASDNLAHGSRFLPFDIASFVMVDDEFGAAGASALGLDAYTRPNQLGQFRALNALVRQTETGRGISPDPVTDLIDNWYSVCGGVNNSACNTCSG